MMSLTTNYPYHSSIFQMLSIWNTIIEARFQYLDVKGSNKKDIMIIFIAFFDERQFWSSLTWIINFINEGTNPVAMNRVSRF